MYLVIGCSVKVHTGFQSYISKVLIDIKESGSRVISNDTIPHHIKWNLNIQKTLILACSYI